MTEYKHREYIEPTLKDLLKALEIILYSDVIARCYPLNYPYEHEFSGQINIDDKSFLSIKNGSKTLYSNSIVIKTSFNKSNKITIDTTCKELKLTTERHHSSEIQEYLSSQFNCSKNNKKRFYLALNKFNTEPSFKNTLSFLSLFDIEFYFGESHRFIESYVAKIKDFKENKPAISKTEKNILKDDLNDCYQKVKRLEKELEQARKEYEEKKINFDTLY